MVELDAASVLTIPRHIHAKEVVERGFMSNFLFANISGIFGAPKELIDAINNMQPLEEPRKLGDTGVTDDTATKLNLDSNGDVSIPPEQVIGTAAGVFGDKVYKDIEDDLNNTVAQIQEEHDVHVDPPKMSWMSCGKNLASLLPIP